MSPDNKLRKHTNILTAGLFASSDERVLLKMQPAELHVQKRSYWTAHFQYIILLAMGENSEID